jgi:hypothetical protein
MNILIGIIIGVVGGLGIGIALSATKLRSTLEKKVFKY